MNPPMYEQRSLLPQVAPPYLLPAWEPHPKPPSESVRSHPKRYSRPGHATGWIEERIGNKKRKTPNTSYFYCYDHREDGKRKRTRIYVPVSKLAVVRQMVEARKPIQAILQVITPTKSLTHHHTHTPKI
jgi:hypothetical protein